MEKTPLQIEMESIWTQTASEAFTKLATTIHNSLASFVDQVNKDLKLGPMLAERNTTISKLRRDLEVAARAHQETKTELAGAVEMVKFWQDQVKFWQDQGDNLRDQLAEIRRGDSDAKPAPPSA